MSGDEDGVFLVVDGLGGHAAGEKAAETAVEVIQAELAKPDGDVRATCAAGHYSRQQSHLRSGVMRTRPGVAWPAC